MFMGERESLREQVQFLCKQKLLIQMSHNILCAWPKIVLLIVAFSNIDIIGLNVLEFLFL